MADTKLETVEPDPSSTGIANDTNVNADRAMEESSPTAHVNSRTTTELPSTDDVDKAIEKVEASKQQKEEGTSKDVVVETAGHEIAKEKSEDTKSAKKEPSERVKEGQRWNNRDRNGRGGRPGTKKNFSHNYKSDLTSQEESSDPVAIRKQVKQPSYLTIRVSAC